MSCFKKVVSFAIVNRRALGVILGLMLGFTDPEIGSMIIDLATGVNANA